MDPAQLIKDNLPLVIGGMAAVMVGIGVVVGLITSRGGPKLAAR